MSVPLCCRCLGLALLAALVAGAELRAQAPDEPDFQREGPLEKLPKNIRIRPEHLSLYADFEHAKGGDIQLYLINATEEERTLSTQGLPYCKRQTLTAPEKWERCDTHVYSWCGNAYALRSLPAGTFYTWTQRRNSDAGTMRPVRFHIYERLVEELTSNEGTGLVGDGEVQFCRQDAMAMNYAPFDVVAGVATGKINGGQGGGDPRDVAIGSLVRFSHDKRLFPLIKEIVAQLPGEEFRIADGRYQSCLNVLAFAKKSAESDDEYWRYLAEPVRTKTGFMMEDTLRCMIRQFEFEPDKMRGLLDVVLADPEHPALRVAISECTKVYDKAGAARHFLAIMQDARFHAEDRERAGSLYEELLENPFVKIDVETGESVEGKAAPLKWLRITNTSPQTITLTGASLKMKVTAGSPGGGVQDPFADPRAPKVKPMVLPLRISPFQVWFHGQPQVLTPGESWEARNVTWWELVEPSHLKEGQNLCAEFSVELPALWKIPARAKACMTENTANILGASHEGTPPATFEAVPPGLIPPR